MYKILLIVAFVITAQYAVASVRVTEFVVRQLAEPEHAPAHQPASETRFRKSVQAFTHNEPSSLAVYPVAGTVGRDVVVPYYVDLDPSDTRLDFNCGRLTFNGHGGHDPYIRSFSEQRIGVPVFAVRDGIVRDVHDGEPDENTTNDPQLKSNYVSIRHNANEVSNYVHLRRGSITVERGQFVTAGTQIGLVGSSGPSTAPHIHFEALYGDVPYEPMAGPCRPGQSYFPEQHEPARDVVLLGATFSGRSFSEFAAPPFDDAPHTGTFIRGPQTIYFKADLANVGATTRYELRLQPPGSASSAVASSGTLVRYDTSLASVWWGLEVNLSQNGTWNLVLEINDRDQFVLPFTVVGSPGAVVNRPPNNVRAELGPLVATQVAVCRAVGDLVADPDYDVVQYRYEWRVDGELVRDVTTAATSDALPRQHAVPHAMISCSVTPSDGVASAQTATAHTTVSGVRRRGVRQ